VTFIIPLGGLFSIQSEGSLSHNRMHAAMTLKLLDDSLRVNVYYEESDSDFEDNICICILEDCPEDEKIFKADEVNL
jgi:hypothetical protein